MAHKVYLVAREDRSHTTYYIRTGLSIFWESGPREMAKEFTSRALAVKRMHNAGKHLEGWRIIVDRINTPDVSAKRGEEEV